MGLFPSRTKCFKQVRSFAKDESDALSEIWRSVGQPITPESLAEIQEKVARNLRSWQAYRNQCSPRNERFLEELFADSRGRESLSQLIQATQVATNLKSILQLKEPIEIVYAFLRDHMLTNGVPARIVTISKTLLMLAGFTPALDSIVLSAIKKSNPDLLACPGVWPFCLYWETLQFVADEQESWERKNGPMFKLAVGVPIGQLMDRILWKRLPGS